MNILFGNFVNLVKEIFPYYCKFVISFFEHNSFRNYFLKRIPNLSQMKGSFCGAGRPLILVRDGELVEFRKGPDAIGHASKETKEFETILSHSSASQQRPQRSFQHWPYHSQALIDLGR